MIHGDIKPQNVLVFEDGSGKITPKVIDFGYSTLSANAGDAGIFLPKSRPWNAPEHHFEEFKFSEAKNADIYSFGMLCLWVLFGDKLLTVTTDGETECVSFDEPLARSGLTLLERLKNDDKMEDIANKLIETRLDREHESSLKRFFSSTVTCNFEKRESGIGILVDLFGQER